MKKKDILKILEKFDDEDNLSIDGVGYIPDIEVVCGKGQAYMAYYCTRKPGHEGDCYCNCKNVEFTPESEEEQQEIHDYVTGRKVASVELTKHPTEPDRLNWKYWPYSGTVGLSNHPIVTWDLEGEPLPDNWEEIDDLVKQASSGFPRYRYP